ncbi:hypothetical protein FK531_16585 [Rhodococcus spelaei]|uniref:Phospholipase n=1 Tax=Rhodococcus spelaei TaxID=2546320 RepID=A0A541B4M6_9NOCA|nr:hypothetical protein FK531_16585 [Rhodococcus spelaei]
MTTALAPHPADASTGPALDAAASTAQASAARAIETVTSTDPATAAAAMPVDFDAVMGYRPTRIDGMLVNPHGDCSSPVPLPAEFDTACKGHDLGYDLLRYADVAGAPLGPWARQALDRQLDERMHAACATRPDDESRTSCYVMANVATAAVNSNSWRQNYDAPRPEPIGAYALAGGVGITLLVGAAVVHRRRREPEFATTPAGGAVPA